VLNNEKYSGRVLLGKTYTGDFPNNKQHLNRGEQEQYLAEDAHEPIIDNYTYEQVQSEMKRRSNIEVVDEKPIRKKSHYSTKRTKSD
jgi:site-specific DNA recombinase